MGCVYHAINRVNGKRYVGKTSQSFSDRQDQHRASSERGAQYPFSRAIRKYGFDAFDWVVVFESEDEAKLLLVEGIEVRRENSIVPNGYNGMPGGGGMRPSSRKTSGSLKGKSYEEIYGDRADYYRTLRHSPLKNYDRSESACQRRRAAGRKAAQTRRQRGVDGSARYQYNGEIRSLKEWCRILGLNSAAVWSRIARGHSLESAFSIESLRSSGQRRRRERERSEKHRTEVETVGCGT